MSTPSSRKTYTRRNTRTRLIDLLKEAIELVEKGCPPGHMTRGPALQTLPSAMPPKTKVPLSAIAEEELLTQANSLLAASELELEKGRALESEADSYMKTQGVTQKKKGTVRPGVLKYNEFVKKWISEHPEYQAKGKYQAALKEIQRSGNWDRVSGTRKKPKAVSNAIPAPLINATPARVSPAVSLRNQANPSTANSSPSTAPLSATPANATPANATPANATPASTPALTPAPTPAPTPANAPYTNEGVDDNVGMRKISMNGRSLYMSSDNALFEREGNSPGDFIGRLVDGKIVEEEAPELPEYS